MTTDITELAQRARINSECGEHLSPAETMELVEALESEKRICATWRKTAKSTGEKLEKAQAKATQQGNIACALFDEVTQLRRHADDKAPELRAQLIEADGELEALRQRIAELESRTVTVKLPDDNAAESESPEDDAVAWFDEGWNARGKADKEALADAGIKWEAE